MQVGNDVVDLRDPDTHPGARHPRFDLRVFTPDERTRIQLAAAAERVRWTLWAAKESAFKVARKLDATLPFHPRRFAVDLLSETRALVAHKMAGRFQVWVDEAEDWIHAVATLEGRADGPVERPASTVAVADAPLPESSPSERVRKLATDALSPLLSLGPNRLRIVTVRGIPQLHLGNRRLPVDLSLSHHGRVLACSWIAAPIAISSPGRA